MKPEDIEQQSFAIIRDELGPRDWPPDQAAVITRVIHTTADFDYADSLVFTHDAIAHGLAALADGCPIITDTTMAMAGINKTTLSRHGATAHCYIGDPDVADQARHDGTTRSQAAMDKAVRLHGDAVYVVGNAPTALLRLCHHIDQGTVRPRLVVGVPVGFVNVVESKDALLRLPIPAIVAQGRKGGSTVAAAMCNALLSLLPTKDASSHA